MNWGGKSPPQTFMKYKASDISTQLVRQRLAVYNRRVNKLRNLGGSFELLQNKTVKEIITGKTNAQIATELNFLERIGNKENQKLVQYNKTSSEKVPKFFKEYIKRELRRANRNTAKQLKLISPSKEAGTLSTIVTENLAPLNLGKGGSIKEIQSRLKSIERRANPKYYSEGNDRYKKNYIKALRNELGIYAQDLIDRVSKIPAEKLVGFLSDKEYGSDLENKFVYSELEAQYRAEVISNALSHFGW